MSWESGLAVSVAILALVDVLYVVGSVVLDWVRRGDCRE